MKNYRDIIYLRGKESMFVNILFLIVLIIFIIPIAIIFGLRLLYTLISKAQKSIAQSTSNLTSGLEKVY